MSKRDTRPSLTAGNHIYLYRLLSEQLGCGKQTLLPRVEEALASDRMEAADLGFASTRDLLEQLDDFIKLTVFKGGRIYATVIAQPAWDEALAAPEKQQADNSGKPWKRKKADKSLKPVKPRRVKRATSDVDAPVPAVDTAASDADDSPQVASGTPSEAPAEPDTPCAPDVAMDEPAAEAPIDAERLDTDTASAAEENEAGETDDADPAVDERSASENVGEAEQAPVEAVNAQPAITLTVIYDPESANAGMRTIKSTPGITAAVADDSNAGAAEQADESAETVAAIEPADQPDADEDAPAEPAEGQAPVTETASATMPGDAPVDFAYDVYCPADLLAEVSYLLPYGADVLGIMTEYYHIARLRGILEAARNRIVFPLGYTRDGARHTVTISLKRSSTHGGTPWIVDGIAH